MRGGARRRGARVRRLRRRLRSRRLGGGRVGGLDGTLLRGCFLVAVSMLCSYSWSSSSYTHQEAQRPCLHWGHQRALPC